MDSFFTAYRIDGFTKILPDANPDDYMIGLWFQQIGADISEVYLPIDCADAPEL